ncbi:hypothetical protein HN011_004519 [Eciton burchellii]|nr:hypothetical protein HN011_004519 [Eciton burchellii]
MNLPIIHWISHFPKSSLIPSIQYMIQTKSYAKVSKKSKKVSGKTAKTERLVLPVETDVNKLVNYVCGTNIYKEGEDVKIKPDSEYPSWLWTIRTGPPPSLEEMDPNTKQYWRKMRLLGLKKKNKERMMKKF